MPKVFKNAIAIPGILAFILVLAMMPVMLQESGGTGVDALRIVWSNGMHQLREYAAGFATGESFRFFTGKNEFSFWSEIGGYFSVSFLYIAGGALAGTTLGILVGLAFAYSRSEWWKRIVEITGVLPDFVIIILLQFTIVQIAKETGVVVFRVANFSTDQPPAIMLPLVSMIIIPTLYMIRNVALQTRLTLTEDYIGNAKARGLGKAYITFFHALPNVLPFIKADLHKFMGIMVGNLFIVEYFYNLRGVTKLLFADGFLGYYGYQYDLVVNGLITLLVMYGLLYGLLRLYIFGWERGVAR
ncbi:ABC transporter permease subunit [Paenibacillus antri]|uniref:ABC transporter permease subunit n=1 Tax=Paenibacillus antri TaxID=2582848 RepID=A0A5R9GFL5_9BACL|nr:ABC transporter permease subunit [Paenibacillus antri]TLS50215.1 ABC transporter permease subunit [Paenibacillus antri]